MSGTYRIEKRQYKLEIPKIHVEINAGHNFWVLYDSNGNVVEEMHGLATGKDGREKAMGTKSTDRLKFHHYKEKSPLWKENQPSQTVFEGSKAEVLERWNYGIRAGELINSYDLPYPSFGFSLSWSFNPLAGSINSNSVASTLALAMGFPEPDLYTEQTISITQKPGDPPINASPTKIKHYALTPGKGNIVLPEDKLNDPTIIYQRSTIDSTEPLDNSRLQFDTDTLLDLQDEGASDLNEQATSVNNNTLINHPLYNAQSTDEVINDDGISNTLDENFA